MPHKEVVMVGLQKLFAVLLYLTALASNGQGQTTSTWLLSGAMDIYIGLDCSGSVSDVDYAREKNDTLAFIRQLPVNPNGTWVGVRPFSYDVADTEVSLTGNMTILEQGIPNLPRIKGNTDISNFLLVAIGKLMSASARNVLKVIVIFTDGYSRYPSRVVSAVDLATKNNIQIFAVPVGSRINVPSLNSLVGANNTISSAASLSEDLQTYVQLEEARLAATYPTTPFVEATPTGSTLGSTSTSSTFSASQSPVNTTVSVAYTTSQEYVTSSGLTSQQPTENSTLLAGSSTSQNDGTSTRITSMLPSNSSSPSTARSSQPDVSRTDASKLTATSTISFEAYNTSGTNVHQATAMSSQNGVSTTVSIGTPATTNSSTVTFTSVANSLPGNSTTSAPSSVSNSTTATPSSVGNSTAATRSSPNSADTSLTTATLLSVRNSTTTMFNSPSNSTTVTLNSAVNPTTAVPNPTGNSTTTVPNSTGNSTTAVPNPTGNSTTTVPNPTGNSTTAVPNSTGNSTTTVPNPTGNSTTAVPNSTGNSTTAVPNSTGNSTTAVPNPTGNSTTAVPNSTGNSTTAVPNPTGNSTTAVPNSTGNSTSAVPNPTGNSTTAVPNSTGNSTTAVSSSTSNSTKAIFNTADNSTTVTLSPVGISTSGIVTLTDNFTSRATTSTGTLATPINNSLGNSSSSTAATVGNFTSGAVNTVNNSFSSSVESFGTSAAENSITRASSSSSLSSSSPITASNVSVGTVNSSGNATSSPSQSFFTSDTTTVDSGGNLTTSNQGGDPILGRSTSGEVSGTNTDNLLSNSTMRTVNSLGNSTLEPTNSLSNVTVSTANSVNTVISVAADSAGTTTTPSAVANSTSSARSSTGKSTITAVILGDNSTTSIVTSLGNSTSAATDSVSNFTLSAATSGGSFSGSTASVEGTLTAATTNLIGNYTSKANSSFGSPTSGPSSSVDISTTTIRSVGNATSSMSHSIGASTSSITKLAGNSTAATSLTSTEGTSSSSANDKPYSFASTTRENDSSGDLTASTHLVAGNKSDVTQTPVATGFTEKRNSDLSSAGAPSATATERTSAAFSVSNTESIVASSGTTPDAAANITVSKSTSNLQDASSTLPLTMNASTTKNGSHSDVSGPTVTPGGSNTQTGTPFYPDFSMTTNRSSTTPLFNFTNIIDTTRPSTYPELTTSSNTMGTSVTPRPDDKTPIGQAGVGVTEPAVRTGTTMDIQTGHETISGTSRDVSWPRDWTPTTERGLASVSSERHSSDPNPTNIIPSDTEDTTPHPSITDRATTPAKSGGICASKELVISSGVGHLRHPYRCDLYIQCYKSPDGNIIAVTRQCKPGLLWNPTLGACDWAFNVNCPTDKCRTSSLQNYNMAGNCRAFWSCQQGRSTAMCCKPGSAYFPGQGCVACAKCLDQCPEKCRSGDVCKVRPVWGSPYNYQIDLGLFGWMTSTCFSGTFNLASCSCSTFNTFSTKGCSLYLSLTFNDAVSEYSKIQMNNLLTDRGSAVFVGNSAVTVPFSPADTYLRLAEKPMVLRLRYMEQFPLSMLRVIVRSTPCKTGGQLVVYADDDGIYVKVFSQQGEVASATLLTEGFVTTIWKMLEVRYTVNQLTVSVTSGSLTYMSSVKVPISLSMADCGWTLGHPVDIRQLQGYTGRMDDVQLFYCTM